MVSKPENAKQRRARKRRERRRAFRMERIKAAREGHDGGELSTKAEPTNDDVVRLDANGCLTGALTPAVMLSAGVAPVSSGVNLIKAMQAQAVAAFERGDTKEGTEIVKTLASLSKNTIDQMVKVAKVADALASQANRRHCDDDEFPIIPQPDLGVIDGRLERANGRGNRLSAISAKLGIS